MNATPLVGAALAAVLSSGLTAAYLRATMPETVAIDPDPDVADEQRHLAALLVALSAPFAAVSAGGPVDAQALRAQGLEALGFTRGWTRTWRAPDERKVDSFVLEFADAGGARSYAQGIGRVATLLVEPRAFAVEGVPGASGLADEVADSDGHHTQVVVLARGKRAVLLVVAAASAAPDPAVVDLARRQYEALGA